MNTIVRTGAYTDFVTQLSVYLTEQSKAPEFAVVIKSPSELNSTLRDRAKINLENGSSLVWLIYADKILVEVYRPNSDIELLIGEDVLDGGEVFPELSLPVKNLFPPKT
jgi:hypothetical protein